MEQAIIAACIASREACDVVTALDAVQDLSPNGIELYKHISNYYQRDSKAKEVDTAVLLGIIEAKKPHSYEKLSTVINNLPDGSPDNLVSLLTDQRLRRIGADMTAALASGDNDRASALSEEFRSVHELGVSSGKEETEEEGVYQGVSLYDLTASLRDGANISLLPGILSAADGEDKETGIVYNLMPGDHIVLFGAVNSGKSAIAVQALCDFAYEGHTVLYVGNEDPAERMIIRIICNLVGIPLSEAERDMEGVTIEAKENGYDNIIFAEKSPGTVSDVRKLCEKYKPKVCVVDQARNLIPDKRKGAFEDNQAEVMYQLRMLYKELRVVGVSITQAATKDLRGKDITTKLKLEQSDVFGSKVEVAAQADVMVGAGANDQMREQGRLFINVCKNKATGKHDGVYVFIDPLTSTVKGN